MQLIPNKPQVEVNLSQVDGKIAEVFRTLLRVIRDVQLALYTVLNFNEITQVSQNTQPAMPAAGRMILWFNTSGTVTERKAKLIANIGGTQVTFNSVEVY